jgi:hypothetical protein
MSVAVNTTHDSYVCLLCITLPCLAALVLFTKYFFRVINLKRLRWAGHVARTGRWGNAHRILVSKREGKSSLGNYRRRREDNTRVYSEVSGLSR